MKMTESQKLECKIKREFFMEIVQTFNSNDKAAIINKLDQIREKKENGDKFSITNVVLTKILWKHLWKQRKEAFRLCSQRRASACFFTIQNKGF